MCDSFLSPIWDPQAHKVPKMTFPQGGQERTFYMCYQTPLGCQKSKNIKIFIFLPDRPIYCDSRLTYCDNRSVVGFSLFSYNH